MAGAAPFHRIAILGTGLVGGSFGLALRRDFVGIRIVGWDREKVLERAKQLGVVDEIAADPAAAIHGADIVYLALPIGVTLELLPQIAQKAQAGAIVTDACSTKAAICRMAEREFRGSARFLGGHPIAGREVAGLENADGELFRNARYAVIAREDDADPRVKSFVEMIRSIGSEPVFCDAEAHDWAVGVVSHLPQLVTVALARVILDETDETGLPVSLAGSGLRDLLRISGSPYEIWRDICLTNAGNIARSLDRFAQAIEHLRNCLMSRGLEEEFRASNELYKILHQLQ